MPDDFEAMWRDLAPVGRSAATRGYFRQPFTAAWHELVEWFTEQARARGLPVRSDDAGNVVAVWSPDGVSGPSVMTGSHLDSVLDGGAYGGPLGLVAAFAAVDALREQGVVPTKPVEIASFAEEEGSRFGLACLGSRLATGSLSWPQVRQLRDRDGVWLADALGEWGGSDTPDEGTAWLLPERVGAFVELHVEQGRDLVDRDATVGVASGIWPHGRWRFDFAGEANHAGTTRMEDRADPMLTYALTALAANKVARRGGQRATFGRVEVTPNGTNAVPSRVSAWLDARADSEPGLGALIETVTRQAGERAARDGTSVDVVAESVSGAVSFDAELTRLVADDRWPVIPTAAGHDAGVLAAAGIPTAMLFVRNPTGVSHSPAEHADLADCLTGAQALAAVLARLAR